MKETRLADRQRWMAVLARADGAALAEAAGEFAGTPHHLLRPPETGMVMVRGRTGGSGHPFNLGEATVTRCTVQLGCGVLGHAYVLGRDGNKAALAALLDALLQTDAHNQVAARVVEPLAAGQEAQGAARQTAAAATKVDFFTMVRGDG
jgi:alpha-D-ribose 1-methylphosphonate 5-triphosphate synthase subunit PhnG